MTVKQLKEKLDAMDENLNVFFYSQLDEGGDRVRACNVASQFPYCQGDPPSNLPNTFVLIK